MMVACYFSLKLLGDDAPEPDMGRRCLGHCGSDQYGADFCSAGFVVRTSLKESSPVSLQSGQHRCSDFDCDRVSVDDPKPVRVACDRAGT